MSESKHPSEMKEQGEVLIDIAISLRSIAGSLARIANPALHFEPPGTPVFVRGPTGYLTPMPDAGW